MDINDFISECQNNLNNVCTLEEKEHNTLDRLEEVLSRIESNKIEENDFKQTLTTLKRDFEVNQQLRIDQVKRRQEQKRFQSKLEQHQKVNEVLTARRQRGLSEKDEKILNKRSLTSYMLRRMTGCQINPRRKAETAGILMDLKSSSVQNFAFPASMDKVEKRRLLLDMAVQMSTREWTELFSG